jgi:hypothetical protein
MRLKRHILPVLGYRRAAAITTADINKFIADRQTAQATNGEINRELAAIKRAFTLGIRGGKLLTKPYIPMLKENNVRKGFFEREAFEAVRNALPEDLRGMVTFAHITGWRIPSEVPPFSGGRSTSRPVRFVWIPAPPRMARAGNSCSLQN